VDKELLVGRSLFPDMIDVGRELVGLIESSPLHLYAALWFQESLEQNWRLIFAFPEVRIDGPKFVYKKIRSITNKPLRSGLHVRNEDISVVDDRDRFISIFKGIIKVDEGGVRFSKNFINGLYIEDAYIYKMT
jgi:hypothetical protein